MPAVATVHGLALWWFAWPRVLLDTVHSAADVGKEAPHLGDLAVVYDVHAAVDLLLDNLLDGSGKRCFKLRLGTGQSRKELLKSLRAWQNSGVGREDSISAAFHRNSLIFERERLLLTGRTASCCGAGSLRLVTDRAQDAQQRRAGGPLCPPSSRCPPEGSLHPIARGRPQDCRRLAVPSSCRPRRARASRRRCRTLMIMRSVVPRCSSSRSSTGPIAT